MVEAIDLESDDVVMILRHPGTQVFYDTDADNGALLLRAADEIERLRLALQNCVGDEGEDQG